MPALSIVLMSAPLSTNLPSKSRALGSRASEDGDRARQKNRRPSEHVLRV